MDNTEHNKSIDLPLVDKTLWRLWQQEALLQETVGEIYFYILLMEYVVCSNVYPTRKYL